MDKYQILFNCALLSLLVAIAGRSTHPVPAIAGAVFGLGIGLWLYLQWGQIKKGK